MMTTKPKTNPARSAGRRRERRSAAQSELGDDFLVARGIAVLQVVQQLASLGDQLEQAAPRRMVTLVGGEVLAQFVDAGGKQRNLDFRRAGVVRATLERADDLRFALGGQCHRWKTSKTLMFCLG